MDGSKIIFRTLGWLLVALCVIGFACIFIFACLQPEETVVDDESHGTPKFEHMSDYFNWRKQVTEDKVSEVTEESQEQAAQENADDKI